MSMPVSTQPYAATAPLMAVWRDEKGVMASQEPQHAHHCHHDHELRRGRCNRSRRIIKVVLIALLSLFFLLAVSYLWNAAFSEGSWFGSLGFAGTEEGSSSMWSSMGAFVKRQASSGTANGGQNEFVHRKLYLIVLFVGLFVVVVLGICLSAWCCKGAFEKPLCCPCYLCACCGGLACLEFISCGICAEMIDNA